MGELHRVERVQLSPEAELFLGSIRDSFGELLVLFDASAPEAERLRWISAADSSGAFGAGCPPGYSPWARISCGSVLIRSHDLALVEASRLFVDVAEFSPGSASAPCPSLRLCARLAPLERP
jgi:hypothetical protein